MDHEIARAAAEDAANRQMRKAGRECWNEDDWNLACAEFERLTGEHRLNLPTGSYTRAD